MEALRFQLKYLPKLIYRGHDEIVFRDTGGRGGVKKRTPKIDERYPASSTCPRLHNNNDEKCVFRIPSTARLALYAKATKRTIPVESLRGDWILDISNRILIVRFFKYRMLDGISSVCGNEGFFRFGIVVERVEIFLL